MSSRIYTENQLQLEGTSVPVSLANPPVPTANALRRGVYIPEHYETNYPYPLIVWIQAGNNPFEMRQFLPLISTRNYFGLSISSQDVPPPTTFPGDIDAPPIDCGQLEKRIYKEVCQLRRVFHIHSERIYLAGVGAAATQALQLMLSRPEWFAGVISLAGEFPKSPRALRRFRDLRGKRVLLSAGTRNQQVSTGETVAVGRLLHIAGMEVTTRLYDCGRHLTRPLLRDIDHWVMQGIAEAQFA